MPCKVLTSSVSILSPNHIRVLLRLSRAPMCLHGGQFICPCPSEEESESCTGRFGLRPGQHMSRGVGRFSDGNAVSLDGPVQHFASVTMPSDTRSS